MRVDLVTYFDELHDEAYKAMIELPFAALSLDFSKENGGMHRALLESHGLVPHPKAHNPAKPPYQHTIHQ
jgi:hypothetical protein